MPGVVQSTQSRESSLTDPKPSTSTSTNTSDVTSDSDNDENVHLPRKSETKKITKQYYEACARKKREQEGKKATKITWCR